MEGRQGLLEIRCTVHLKAGAGVPEKADAPVMHLHIRLLARSEEVTKVKERQGEVP